MLFSTFIYLFNTIKLAVELVTLLNNMCYRFDANTLLPQRHIIYIIYTYYVNNQHIGTGVPIL